MREADDAATTKACETEKHAVDRPATAECASSLRLVADVSFAADEQRKGRKRSSRAAANVAYSVEAPREAAAGAASEAPGRREAHRVATVRTAANQSPAACESGA